MRAKFVIFSLFLRLWFKTIIRLFVSFSLRLSLGECHEGGERELSISATTFVLRNHQDHLKVRQPCRNYCDY